MQILRKWWHRFRTRFRKHRYISFAMVPHKPVSDKSEPIRIKCTCARCGKTLNLRRDELLDMPLSLEYGCPGKRGRSDSDPPWF